MTIRTALVTGAAQGMGRAIAVRLARDGLNVAINDLQKNESKLQQVQRDIEKLDRKSIICLADISNSQSVEDMMQTVSNKMGSLDVAVANAGICHMKSLIDISADEWDQIFAVNMRGVFLCYKEAAKIMIKQGRGGKLIAACSTAGYKAFEKAGHYSAAKWGVRGLTQVAALEWAPYKITVNSYCPGMIKTALVDSCTEILAKETGASEETIVKSYISNIPLGRIGTPDDVANLVSFLVSKDADYITGQNILINGGWVLS